MFRSSVQQEKSNLLLYHVFPPSSLQLKQNKEKAFCFKGNVRKIGKYIFLLRNNKKATRNLIVMTQIGCWLARMHRRQEAFALPEPGFPTFSDAAFTHRLHRVSCSCADANSFSCCLLLFASKQNNSEG